MQAVQTRPTDGPRASFLDGRGALAVLLVAAACVFTATSFRPLTHSELRYVEAGREMLESGDWVVPRLSYVAYFEKPILAYWLQAAAQAAFGLSEVAVRAPSILACVAMTWTAYALGRAARGPRFGLGAGALFVASAMTQELGPAVLTDPPFAAFLAFAWYAFWRHDRRPSSRWIWAFWTSLAFAVLTKGPLGVVLAGTAIGAYLLLAGRLRDALRMRLVRGTLILVAVNLPWWWLVGRRDPRYVSFFFIRENFEAFFSDRINHPGPPWDYVRWIPVMVFPFAALGAWAVVVAIVEGLRRRGAAADPWRLYLSCLFAAPFLFLSASASKLGTYLLPLLPATALLFAAYVADRLPRPTAMLRRATLVQGAVLGVAALVVALFFDRLPASWTRAAAGNGSTLALAVGVLVAPMVLGGVVMARGRIVRGMAVVAAGGLACVLVVNARAPDLGIGAEAGELVRLLRQVRRPEEPVVVSWSLVDDYSVVLALRERPLIVGNGAELGMGHFTEVTSPDVPLPKFEREDGKIRDVYHVGAGIPLPQNPWIFDQESFRRRWEAPERMWLVCRDRDVGTLRGRRFVMHVFAEKESRAVATNLPLPDVR
jgi:4-amino-4-deoxy-L-arabinose transferase-like glycosyltransferase